MIIPFFGISQETHMLANNDSVYVKVDSMPIFPEGETAMFKFVSTNVIYPKEAIRNNISGKVFLSFVIGKDGVVKDIKVLRRIHPLLDEEAINVVRKMPKWKPGKHNGELVNVSYRLPINFVL